jgi:AAA domain
VNEPVPERRAVALSASSTRRERLSYLEPGRIPLGLVTVIGGYAGLGKSQYTCLLAANLSRGDYGEPAAALIATAEDSPSTTVRPRLEAVQADLELVHFVVIQSDDGLTDGIEIPGDLDSVADEMRRLSARLLIVDPLVAHLPTEIDSHKDQSVRRALAPLYRLAQELDCAVVVCIHLNKAQGMQPLQRLSGSGAFGAAARSVLLLDRDPDDPDGEQGRRRVLAHVKSNDGPEMPSLLYEIEPIVLPAGAEQPEVDTSRLALLGESPHSGRALLASAAASEEERFAKDEAEEFLRGELEDGDRIPSSSKRIGAYSPRPTSSSPKRSRSGRNEPGRRSPRRGRAERAPARAARLQGPPGRARRHPSGGRGGHAPRPEGAGRRPQEGVRPEARRSGLPRTVYVGLSKPAAGGAWRATHRRTAGGYCTGWRATPRRQTCLA